MPATAIRTAIVIETLPRGRWLAWPFADPELAQLGGPNDDPLLIMQLALPEHLTTLTGADIARYATPQGTHLGTTVVAIDRPDPHAKHAHLARVERFSVALPWVATPYGKDLWLHIPQLLLTLRVDDPAEIPSIVAAETRRLIAATEPTANDLLRLFPALDYRLAWIDLSLEGSKDARTATAKSIAAREAHALLVTVATPVHADRRVLEGAPLLARPGELEELARLLDQHSVLVCGPELSGKTALIEGWLRARLATAEPRPKDEPALFVYATSGARLMAGMSALGQWQERLKRVLTALTTLRAVLWIEHLGELIGDSGSGQELANALRPWLEDGRVRLVTELRDEEVERLERRSPALMSTLRRVRLTALTPAATLQVLQARNAHQRVPGQPTFSPDGLHEVAALASRYQTQLAAPGAAVRLLDDLRGLADKTTSATAALDAVQVQRLYATMTGLPLWLLDDRRPYDLLATEATLAKTVVGQPAAVRAVAESLAVIKTRLAARGKPLASFLFAGPTGVGKTELARALAVHLFGSDKRLVRFDMSEFMDASAAERLIRGPSSGEAGQRDGLLTRQLRREPLSVILLDEIEKAHASVFDLLLQALGEGRLTDASGRTASLEGCIVILTSNLGAADRNRKVGLTAATTDDSLAQHYLAAVRRHFAPEMVNRIERIIPFAALGAETLRTICRLQVDRVRRRRGLADIALHVSDAALDHIAAAGTTAEYGARALRRAVDRLLVTPLAHTLASHPVDTVAAITVQLDAAQTLSFTVASRPPDRGTSPLHRIARLRQEARGYLRTQAIREVHDRLEQLDADLMRGGPPGPLLAERARLDGLLQPFRAITDELEQLEDLLYIRERKSAVFPPEVETELLVARERLDELATASFEVLTALDGRRDHALLALTELDEGRAFDRWLLPFMEAAEARRWTVHAWVAGERPEPKEQWPYDLPFGPPRAADDLYIRIAERPTDFRHLLVGVSGRHAGTLLACEGGVLAFRGAGPAAHLLVTMLSTLRSTVTPEAMRDSDLLTPPPSESWTPLTNGPKTRIFSSAPDGIKTQALNRGYDDLGTIDDFFAHWERHAARLIRTYDDDLEHDRGELFDNPFDDEQRLRALIRDDEAQRQAEIRSGRPKPGGRP